MRRSFGVVLLLSVRLGPCGQTETRPSSSPEEPLPTAVVDAAPPHEAGPKVPPKPPEDLDVLLITIDCLRADMPWAGYPRPIAPRLTELAQRSVVYTHAYSLSSYTSMSLGGFLGGKLPGELKRDGYFFGVYARENVMFPEFLQARGIRTLGGHAHGYFHDAGFDQGFDRWEVVPNLKWNPTTDENITSPQLEGIAEKLLSDVDASSPRFFAWFHFLDPHDQYLSHPGIGPYGNTPRDRYDAEVTFTDGYIGKLLDFVAAQPWGKRTAIIVTADHGEAFGEHHQYVHGFELWENLVRVPLFFLVPGASPRTIDVPRSAVDLAPTILELMNVPASTEVALRDDSGTSGTDASSAVASFEGTSLVSEIFGGPTPARDVAIDLPETSDNDKRRALVHGDLKIIAFGKNPYVQVFDLNDDPGELHPIGHGTSPGTSPAADAPDPRAQAFDDMLARYRAFEKTVKDVPPTKCNEGCLNGAYAKKDGGVDGGVE
jgi:choline-sulfatase